MAPMIGVPANRLRTGVAVHVICHRTCWAREETPTGRRLLKRRTKRVENRRWRKEI